MAADLGSSWSPRRRIGALSLVIGLTVGVPVLLSVITGSIHVPHNDAWAYSKIAQVFAQTGQFRLIGWNRSSLIGQVVILGPLGAYLSAQSIFAALCGAVCVVATYFLVRPRAGDAGALLAAACLGVAPDFGLLSTSFMADIPALAGVLVCLWAGDRAIRRNSPLSWWAGLAVGVWAVTIREQSLIAPAAVLVAGWVKRQPGRRHVVLGAAAVLGATGGFELWRRSLPGDDQLGYSGVSAEDALSIAVKSFFTAGLYLLPLMVAVARPLRWRMRVWLPTAVIVLLGVGWLLRSGRSMLLGNYVVRTVAYPKSSVGAPTVLPQAVWMVVLIAALAGAALLVGHTIDQGLPGDVLLLTCGCLLLAGTVLQGAVGQYIFSRYLLALIPIAAGLYLPAPRSEGAPVRVRTGLGVALLSLCLGLVLTSATDAYDAARWQAAQQLVDAGAKPQDIDAGLEWVGSHAGAHYDGSVPDGRNGEWYVSHFQGSRSCYLITGSAQHGAVAGGSFGYPRFGVAGLGSAQLSIYADRCHR